VKEFLENLDKFVDIEWVGPLLSTVDALVKYEDEEPLRWAEILSELVRAEKIFTDTNHAAIIGLCTSATTSLEGARLFLPGLPILLSLKL
jgi:hypothetical protein